MKKYSLLLMLGFGLLLSAGCSKKQPEQTAQNQTPPAAQTNPSEPAAPAPVQPAPPAQAEMTPDAAAPNDLPALVTLTDGSKYRGVLVSKTGSQLTFRGDNGATRTFDSRDVKSIRFGETEAASTPAPRHERAPSAPAPETAATAPPTAESAPPPEHKQDIVIPSGTQIAVRTNEAIDSKTASPGQTFSAEVSQGVSDESGRVVIPRGAPATLVVKQAGAGKIHANELVIDMASVTIKGRPYEVEASDLSEAGKSGVGANKRTGKFVGGGAALGAIIGAIAGGGKGAAIGAASGAGAGAGTQIFTRGSVKVPAETVLTFQLLAPLRLHGR
jgi:hypothetical protein